jgi:predicted GNAT family N-acyltransferase
MDECLSIIREGDAVDLRSARNGLPQAKLVAIAWEGEEIVGVGVVKQKRPTYAGKIAKRSGAPLNTNTNELGYVAVKESERGKKLSRKITEKLLSETSSDPLFATTSSNRMKKTLKNAGFIQQGREWTGKDGQLSLWTRCGTQ